MINNDNYPKILILGETFNSRTGGGITLSNLFKNWPKSKLFNACEYYKFNIIDDDRCKEYYQIGNKEEHVYFPDWIRRLIPIQSVRNSHSSGIIVIDFTKNIQSFTNQECIIKFFLKKIARDFLFFLGLYPLFHLRKISNEFLHWVDKIDPDFIYAQFSDMNSIRFINLILEKKNIPLCIHIMDDWTSTYSEKGIFHFYWKKKVNVEFSEIVKKARIRLAISDGMVEEYKKRYSVDFIPFHNPIEPENWINYTKKDYHIGSEIKLFYAGRIGIGNYHSLSDIASAVKQIKNEGYNISLTLQSPSSDFQRFKRFERKGIVKLNRQVDYKELPSVFSNADILILPYDFKSSGMKYIKYSMPTKVTEYMITGVPILLYCPVSVYIYQHAKKNQWASIVSKNEKEHLIKAIIELIQDEKLRAILSQNAVKYVLNFHNSSDVQRELLNVFVQNTSKMIE